MLTLEKHWKLGVHYRGLYVSHVQMVLVLIMKITKLKVSL